MMISPMQIIVAYTIVLVGVLIGTFLYYRPKIKATKEIDEFTQKENDKLWKQRDRLNKEIEWQKEQLKINKEALEENQKTAAFWSKRLLEMQTEAQQQATSYRNKCFEIAEQELKQKINSLDEHYKESEEDYRHEYTEMMQNAVLEYEYAINSKIKERNELDEEIDDKKSKIAALIEDAKRQYEEEHKQDFYRLCLTSEDIADIYQLRQLIPKLKKPEPVNKVIWKTYYEKPYTDLIGRVVGAGVHTGIYKITNIENKMCYVGQAVNIADRWKTHIKRGLGAETPINNKLYPAMVFYGVENFTFEIIEECDRGQLNEREDYWQEVFKAKEFGYSIK